LAAASILAATPSAGVEPIASSAGDYCAVRIVPVDSGDSSSPVCFDTQREVDGYLETVLAPHPSARAAASVLIGTVYKDDNFSGGSYTFYGAGSCSGVTYGFPSLTSDWQNSVSSAKAYSSCWVTLYDSPSYAGQRYNCTPSCSSLPSFNDRTKSLVFRPAGSVG